MGLNISANEKTYEAKQLYIKPSSVSSLYRILKIVSVTGLSNQQKKYCWYTLQYPIETVITGGKCSLPSSLVFGQPVTGQITPDDGYFYPSTVQIYGINPNGIRTQVSYNYNSQSGIISITAAVPSTTKIYVNITCPDSGGGGGGGDVMAPTISLSGVNLTLTPQDQSYGYYNLFTQEKGTVDVITLQSDIAKDNAPTILDLQSLFLSHIPAFKAGSTYEVFAQSTNLDHTASSGYSNKIEVSLNSIKLTLITGATEEVRSYLLFNGNDRTITVDAPIGYSFPERIMIDNYVGTEQRPSQGSKHIVWKWTLVEGNGSLTIRTVSADNVTEINGRILCSSNTLSSPAASLIKGINDDDVGYIIDTDGRATTYRVFIDNQETEQDILKG